MAYTLTVGGYQFENPPEEYRKLARLSNSPQTAFNRSSAAFYQSDSQNLQFQVEGTLALDPALGGSDDLAELERLQSLAIDGGEVDVEFNPFFSGKCVIEDDPFRQSGGESDYAFTFTVNSESTDSSAYPAHSSPNTGNTFEFGDLDLGYDPNQVAQNYEKQTEQVKRLQGVARSTDTEGLIPKVNVSGMIDGSGQATLWDKARANTLAFLSAEFQNGWCLVDSVSIRNSPEAPDYLQGLFQYDLDILIVMDPSSGIGEVSKYVDREVGDQSVYVSNCDEDGIFERYGKDSEDYPGALDYRVSGGTGKLDGDYIEWSEEFGTLEASTTNYLYVADGDGDGYGSVKEGTSGFPGNTVPLYEIDTGSSSVNDIRDMRSCLTGTRLSDSERGDLNFVDELSVDDTMNFERLLAISDQMAISDPTLPWLGLASLDPETLAVADQNLLPGLGIASLSDVATIDDGGSASTVNQTTTTEATNWGTASDWDAASSQTSVEHDSTDGHNDAAIRLAGLEDDGDVAEYDTSDVAGTYAATTTNPHLGQHSREMNSGNTSSDYELVQYDHGSQVAPSETVLYAYLPNPANGNWIVKPQFYSDAFSTLVTSLGFDPGNSPGDVIAIKPSSGWTTVVSGYPANTWMKFRFVWDWANNQYDLYYNGNQVLTGHGFRNAASGYQAWEEPWDHNEGNITGFIEGPYPWHAGSGSLTTAFKSYTGDVDVTTLELQNVSATLNGYSITVYVESDTNGDGAADEISDPITLDGSGGPYSVTGLTTDTTDFRLQIDESSGDQINTPEFSAADLSGDVTSSASGSDADQNPNTTWEIRGARYDTSGNEYEGGGVVSRYGG